MYKTSADVMSEGEAMCCGMEENVYGCLFCKTGRENRIVAEIKKRFPEVDAIAPMKIRRRRCQGTFIEEQVTLFPSYVFFRTHPSFNAYRLLSYDGVYRLLESAEEDWRLCAADVEIIQRLFDVGDVVGLSEAYFEEGERIRITEGFLKEYEGQILRVNRRAKTAQISIRLHQAKTLLFWLGYEEIRHT